MPFTDRLTYNGAIPSLRATFLPPTKTLQGGVRRVRKLPSLVINTANGPTTARLAQDRIFKVGEEFSSMNPAIDCGSQLESELA